MTRALWAAARAQLQMSLGDPSDLFPLALVPFYTVIFLSIMRAAGRNDLLGYAVLAPVLLNLWYMALTLSGDLTARDRFLETIELLVATPTPYALIAVGRVLASTLLSLLGFVEAWLVARLAFGYTIVIQHVVLFVSTILLTTVATVGTAVVLTAIFAVGRTPRMLQNSLNYPVYVLAGILTPVSLLPAWLQIPARLVYLSWAADLMRDCLASAAPANGVQRLMVIALLGAAAFVLGVVLMRRVIDRLRRTGTMGLA
jgi:ABC-2 type transport system permease protein